MVSFTQALLPLPRFNGCMAPANAGLTKWPTQVEGRMAKRELRPVNANDQRRSAWMAAAQAGDRTLYAALLRDCVPLIQSAARRRGVPPDRVDDVVQDVLLAIHRARETYDPKRSFTAWLVVIAERRAIDLMRRTRRQNMRELHAPLAYESHADGSADPAAGLMGAEAGTRIAHALAGLPPGQREAVQHLVLDQRSLSDTAAATNRTTGAVKVNLHRALRTLRARMGLEE